MGIQALFGVTNEAIIENIKLRNINVSAPFCVSSLVSHAFGGEIRNIDVSGASIIRTSFGADISHSFFNGVINCSGHAGGFVGLSSTGDISYSYTVADMSGVSGIAFDFSGSTGATFNDNYWDSTVSGISTGGVAGEYESLTTVQVKNSANFSTWNTGVWEFVDYPDFRKFD